MAKPILCVDFDGVIHSYTSGWKGDDVIPDPPVEGALLWLLAALDHFNVQIYSSRSKTMGGRHAMQEWLRVWADKEFPKDDADRLFKGVLFAWQKPAAFLTIDDRAITFKGDWQEFRLQPRQLLEFKPWNKS